VRKLPVFACDGWPRAFDRSSIYTLRLLVFQNTVTDVHLFVLKKILPDNEYMKKRRRKEGRNERKIERKRDRENEIERERKRERKK
jgi:hypothetical protein